MNNAPNSQELMQVVDATWPAAQKIPCGPFLLRDGQRGGKRASATTLEHPDFTTADIMAAEHLSADLAQPSLFIIRDTDAALDETLAELGYRSFDFVTLFLGRSDVLAGHDRPGLHAIPAPEPLAAMAEIWASGGILQSRIDVMKRASGKKSFFLGRADDTPAGAAFVAIHNNIAMVHALEVAQTFRRQSLGLALMGAAGTWALKNHAPDFALVVLSQNKAACGLYRRLGMVAVGNYHYRIKP